MANQRTGYLSDQFTSGMTEAAPVGSVGATSTAESTSCSDAVEDLLPAISWARIYRGAWTHVSLQTTLTLVTLNHLCQSTYGPEHERVPRVGGEGRGHEVVEGVVCGPSADLGFARVVALHYRSTVVCQIY